MRRAALEDIWEGRPAPSAGMVVLRLSSVQHCLLYLWKMQIQAPSCPTKTSSQCVCKQTHWATFFSDAGRLRIWVLHRPFLTNKCPNDLR